jgi:hypothetical protein
MKTAPELTQIQASEWITPDVECPFLLVEKSLYPDWFKLNISAQPEAQALYNGEFSVGVVNISDRGQAMIFALGFECRWLQLDNTSGFVVIDVGSLHERSAAQLKKLAGQIGQHEWKPIAQTFTVKSSELVLLTTMKPGPYWGKNEATLEPRSYQIHYSLYSSEGEPEYLLIRLS